MEDVLPGVCPFAAIPTNHMPFNGVISLSKSDASLA